MGIKQGYCMHVCVACTTIIMYLMMCTYIVPQTLYTVLNAVQCLCVHVSVCMRSYSVHTIWFCLGRSATEKQEFVVVQVQVMP